MEYTQLGNSGLNVSRLCMGCLGFGDSGRGHKGWTLKEPESLDIIRHALNLDINFFDTSISYHNGLSEQYLGQAIRKFAKRDEVVIATKLPPRSDEEVRKGVPGQRHVMEMLRASLQNLKTSYIDLYIYEMWDWRTPLYEIMDGLDQAVRSGRVRYLGISNCFAWQLAQANALADREGFERFTTVQGHYNLIYREEEREMFPLCRMEDIALTPYSPLAAGRLTRRSGKFTHRTLEDSFGRMRYEATKSEDNRIIDRVAALANKKERSMTEISLAWILSKVDAPIIGATQPEQLDEAVKALDLELEDTEVAYLEASYVPHPLSGVLARNTLENAEEPPVCFTGDRKEKPVEPENPNKNNPNKKNKKKKESAQT